MESLKQRNEIFDLLIVTFQVLSGVSMFFSSRTILVFTIQIAIVLYMLPHIRLRSPKSILLVVIYITLQYILQAVYYRSFNAVTITRYLFQSFLVTYISYLYFRDRYFHLFCLSIYYLSIIGLIFYIIYLIYPGFQYVVWSLSRRYNIDPLGESIILYQIRRSGASSLYYGNLVRNGGFAWEAGASAALAVMAFFINNIQRYKGYIRRNIVYIVLIISTFSTAGIFTLILALSVFMKRKLSPFFLVAMITIIGSLTFLIYFRVPFFYEKIQDETQLALQTDFSSTKEAQGRFTKYLMYKDYFWETLVVGRTFSQDFREKMGFSTLMEFTSVGVGGIFSLAMAYGFAFMIYYVYLIFHLSRLLGIKYGFSNQLALIMFPIAFLINLMSQGVLIWVTPILVFLIYSMEEDTHLIKYSANREIGMLGIQ